MSLMCHKNKRPNVFCEAHTSQRLFALGFAERDHTYVSLVMFLLLRIVIKTTSSCLMRIYNTVFLLLQTIKKEKCSFITGNKNYYDSGTARLAFSEKFPTEMHNRVFVKDVEIRSGCK